MRRTRPVDRAIRDELAAFEREHVERYPGLWPSTRLDQLERGETVEVHGYEIGLADLHGRYRIDANGAVTPAERPATGQVVDLSYRPAHSRRSSAL